MGYVLGQHLINCDKCKKTVFRDEVVRDRTGYLSCPEHAHKKQPGIDYQLRTYRPDRTEVPAHQRQGEVVQETVSYLWQDIDMNWEDIDLNWEDMG